MNNKRIIECTLLSEEVLRNFELSEIPVQNIILKCARLYRLLGDEEGIDIFLYEACGYPSEPSGIPSKAWDYGKIMGRHYFEKKGEESKEYMFRETISELLANIDSNKERLKVTSDPQSYGDNVTTYVVDSAKNTAERGAIVNNIKKFTGRYNKIQGHLYAYVLRTYQKLKYGNTVEDIFTESRVNVDKKLSEMCPDAIAKFVSVYENVDSNNPEDWANAVHSCRRIFKDFVDVVYPASDTPVQLSNGKMVKIGEDNVINRLVQFIDSKSASKTYSAVVGSTLQYLGERLDSIFNAVNKGTHADLTQAEAKRYIFYTYMTLGDIIALM